MIVNRNDMNNEELSRFIMNYAVNDKTKTAILLTGKWGSGKSFYITRYLCPYLKENKVRCIVVSLYGIDNLTDLSKQVFLNLRLPTLSKKSEAKAYASIIGRCIISNALSFKGLSVSVSDKQLKDLYDSVNLKDVLLVFEDVERSTIDIVKLLGYINGLVEYDSAKVLLVANEEVLLKSRVDDEDSEEVDERVESYCQMKEKTIGDTIQFKTDMTTSVREIMSLFSDKWRSSISDEDEISRIEKIVVNQCNSNLRVLLFALQKCEDIFSSISDIKKYDKEFIQATFEGALHISKRFISSDIPKWKDAQYLSTDLIDSQFPLFRFVYDFLRWNTINPKDIDDTYAEYQKFLLFEKKSSQNDDEDLWVLTNYHTQSEKDVVNALKNVENKLKKYDFIGLNAYEKMAYIIIKAGDIVDYDTERILSLMIGNASKICNKQNVNLNDYIWGIYKNETDSEIVKERFDRFISEFTAVTDNKKSYSFFSYKPSDINEFYLKAVKNRQQYIKQHKFLSWFDIPRLIKMLKKCNAAQINDFRGILFLFYRDVTNDEYAEDDKETMVQLINHLNKEVKGNSSWDKIQLLQIGYLKTNLEEFIEKMSN